MSAEELLQDPVHRETLLLILILLFLIIDIFIRRKLKKGVQESREKIASLRSTQEEVFEDLDQKYTSLREMLLDKTNKLSADINRLSENFSSLRTNNEAFKAEMNNKTKQMRMSLDETEKTFRKLLKTNERDQKAIQQKFNTLSKEIQKMKDDIRERTIDLEL